MSIMSTLIQNTSNSTFKKGEALYKSGEYSISDMVEIIDDGGVKYYNSYEGTLDIYNQALFIKDDDIKNISCDCPAFYQWQGFCKHCVALAFSVMNKNLGNSVSPLIFNDYEKHQLKLIPTFKKNLNRFIVKLKLNVNKDYVIRNPYKFFENVRNRQIDIFGKNEINLSIDQFDDKSIELIEILMDSIKTYDNKDFYITDVTFDKIFDLYKNDYLLISGLSENLIYLSSEEYQIVPVLRDGIISIEEDIKTFTGFKYNYIFKDNTLYRQSNIDKNIKHIYDQILNKKKVSIKGNEKKFMKKIAQDMPELDIEFEDYLKYQGDRINIDTYLDYDNSITLEYKFIKNGLESKEFECEEFDEYKKVLDEFKFINNEITDELDIVDFINKDLSRFRDFGILYVSDRLNNLKVTKPSNSNISIKYDVDLLEVSIENDDLTEEDIKTILKAYKKKKRYVKLKGNILDIDDYDDLRLLTELNIKNNILGKHEIESYNIFRLKDYLKGDLKEIVNKFNNIEKLDYKLCDSLNGVLRDYQKTGFNFLKLLTDYKLGGVLADDMGLGKTLQMISLIKSDNSNKSSIIVCPTSLIYNWYNEIIKWGFDEPVVITGSQIERLNIIKNISDSKIFITSYDSLRRDIENYNYKFRFIIADEAQYIKNINALKTKAIKSLESEIRFAMTGTPIENRLQDLWSIFDFIMPNYLQTNSDFKEYYETPIIQGDKKRLKELVKKISPFVLRRCKTDVLKELPPKIEKVLYINMSDEQRKLYETYYLDAINKIGNIESKIEILSVITRLRQLCVDPRLFIENYQGPQAKLDMAMNIIHECIENNHRILLFSQFTSTFDFIKKELDKSNIRYSVIKGDVSSHKRIEIVDEFNNDESVSVCLISLKAGGSGLNLIGADTVIHFDPWWNIAAENQATDRTHRIGQKRSVNVIKLICSNTIEQRVLELQEMKKGISESVITEGNINLSNSDLKYLFK